MTLERGTLPRSGAVNPSSPPARRCLISRKLVSSSLVATVPVASSPKPAVNGECLGCVQLRARLQKAEALAGTILAPSVKHLSSRIAELEALEASVCHLTTRIAQLEAELETSLTTAAARERALLENIVLLEAGQHKALNLLDIQQPSSGPAKEDAPTVSRIEAEIQRMKEETEAAAAVTIQAYSRAHLVRKGFEKKEGVDLLRNVVQESSTRNVQGSAVPEHLRVTIPNDVDHCGGLYRLVEGKLINNYNYWQHEQGHRWLYSSLVVTAWIIGGPDEASRNFACDEGFVANAEAHRGNMPNMMSAWFVDHGNEEWEIDEDIKVEEVGGPELGTVPTPNVLPLSSRVKLLRLDLPKAEFSADIHSSSGLYRLLDGRVVNGSPIWLHQSGHRWLFRGMSEQIWLVGGEEENSAGFACDSSFLISGRLNAGEMPHEVDSWYCDDHDDDDGWIHCPQPIFTVVNT